MRLTIFLRFVLGNQEMKCPGDPHSGATTLEYPGPGRFTPVHGAFCCNGTGRVPRPEAMELLVLLTEECTTNHVKMVSPSPYSHSPQALVPVSHEAVGCAGRVPRSPAEQHVALEEWLVDHDFTITLVAGGGAVVGSKGGASLQEAAKTALVASGWTALVEIEKK